MITGFQRDVRPYIAACDSVVLCSVTEAFSLAAIEVMALSKPVVHSDAGTAARETVRPRFTADRVLARLEKFYADLGLAGTAGARARTATRSLREAA